MRKKSKLVSLEKKTNRNIKTKKKKKACIYCYRTQLINSICDLTDAVSQFLR